MAVRDDSTVRIIEELNTKINFETFLDPRIQKMPKNANRLLCGGGAKHYTVRCQKYSIYSNFSD